MFLRGWILTCSAIVMAGWILSPFYGIASLSYLLITLALMGCWIKWEWPIIGASRQVIRQTVRRLMSGRLLLPGFFGISVLLLLIKGLSTDPCHDDGLCYRIPRAMNWIMEHRWHWIAAQDSRLNTRGTVSEWLTVPLMLFFKNDRLVFLPNWISDLFLPGLIFSVWRGFGVRPRIAWMGMWLIPTGYCFALQAVNSSNDSIGVFFLLAAFYYALKPGGEKSWGDVALSTLSIALSTGVKLNFLPFVLPWVVAISPAWRTFLRYPQRSMSLLLAAGLISFFPIGLMNWMHGAGFSGLILEPTFVVPPFYTAFVGNFFLIAVQNLVELPWTTMGHFQIVYSAVQNSALGSLLNHNFQAPALGFYSYLAIEEVGLGFGVTGVLFFLLAASCPLRHDRSSMVSHSGEVLRSWILPLCIWAIFFQFMCMANTDQPARIACPFYALLVPTLLKDRVFRSYHLWRWGKPITAMVMMAGLWFSLTMTENPLGGLGSNPDQYSRGRNDLYFQSQVQKYVPSQEKVIGIVRFWNERETWLWRPYGQRKVVELPFDPSQEDTDHAGVSYLAISGTILTSNRETIETWLKRNHFQLIASLSRSPYQWYLVKRVQTPVTPPA